MLFVKTILKPSEIEGMGLFADESIKKGMLIMKFDSLFDRIFLKQDILRMNRHALDFCERYASTEDGIYYLSIDNSRFINHSTTPNIIGSVYNGVYALKDIDKGDEITINYAMNKEFKGFK